MTRVRCFVRACNNASYKKDSNCSFHDFPSDKKLKEKWLAEIMKYEKSCGWSEWLRNDLPKTTVHSKICSDHFEPQCFLDFSKLKKLNPTAVPTVFTSPFQSAESVRNSGIITNIIFIFMSLTRSSIVLSPIRNICCQQPFFGRTEESGNFWK